MTTYPIIKIPKSFIAASTADVPQPAPPIKPPKPVKYEPPWKELSFLWLSLTYLLFYGIINKMPILTSVTAVLSITSLILIFKKEIKTNKMLGLEYQNALREYSKSFDTYSQKLKSINSPKEVELYRKEILKQLIVNTKKPKLIVKNLTRGRSEFFFDLF